MLHKKIICGFFVSTLLLVGCKDDESISISTNFDRLDDNSLRFGDKLSLDFSSEDAKIDSYSVKLNDKAYNTQKDFVLDTLNSKLGLNHFTVTVNYNGKYHKDIDGQFTVFSSVKEKKLTYKVIQEFPHNTQLFTEGFIYKDGMIYESAGQYGKSQLVKYALGSETFSQSVKNDPKIFGEGISIVNGKIYQLSYHERKGFIYDEATLNLLGGFTMPPNIVEGWGSTTLPNNEIVVSDSTPTLKFFDDKFNFIKSITVTGYDSIYSEVNELEYANGYIYSNIFNNNSILVIDPKTGVVIAKGDFTELVNKNKTDNEAVLNGIAHISGNTFLITGKLWSKIYKVELNIE